MLAATAAKFVSKLRHKQSSRPINTKPYAIMLQCVYTCFTGTAHTLNTAWKNHTSKNLSDPYTVRRHRKTDCRKILAGTAHATGNKAWTEQ